MGYALAPPRNRLQSEAVRVVRHAMRAEGRGDDQGGRSQSVGRLEVSSFKGDAELG